MNISDVLVSIEDDLGICSECKRIVPLEFFMFWWSIGYITTFDKKNVPFTKCIGCRISLTHKDFDNPPLREALDKFDKYILSTYGNE